MDWLKILKCYIRHVARQEGATYIEPVYGTVEGLTSEEMAALYDAEHAAKLLDVSGRPPSGD